jgi:hypothetical protein
MAQDDSRNIETILSSFILQINKDDKFDHYIDGQDKSRANWMRFINCALVEAEQNVVAVQFYGHIYYQTCVEIGLDVELLVWYGDDYADELGLFSEPLSAQPTTLPLQSTSGKARKGRTVFQCSTHF